MKYTTELDKGTSLWRIVLQKLLKNQLACFGIIILSLIIVSALLAPILTSYEIDTTDLFNTYQAPSQEHILGTDELGRDVLTRLLYGGRVSISVGLVSTLISVTIGVILGAIGGYYGGLLDQIIMRLVDIFMSFPFFVIAITAAAIFGPSILNVMLISGFLSWTSIARIVRAEVMGIKQREYVEAAKVLGLTPIEIIVKHILPNTLGVIIVYATLNIATGILAEAGLSYLGLGVRQPQPSWGNILASAQSMRSLKLHWWLWVPSGVLVFMTILSINFIGDGIRDALDAKFTG